jgi:YggT family protein
MLYQIASLLLDVIGGLLTGACLLRLYMQWQRVPFSNPVGAGVCVDRLAGHAAAPADCAHRPWDLSSLVGLLVQHWCSIFCCG